MEVLLTVADREYAYTYTATCEYDDSLFYESIGHFPALPLRSVSGSFEQCPPYTVIYI